MFFSIKLRFYELWTKAESCKNKNVALCTKCLTNYLFGKNKVEIKERHDSNVADEKLDVVSAQVDELEHGERHQKKITASQIQATTDVLFTFL